MKKIKIVLLIFGWLFSLGKVKAVGDFFQKKEKEGLVFYKKKQSSKFLKNHKTQNKSLVYNHSDKIKSNKHIQFRFFKWILHKKDKRTPPRKGDDLWILKLIYLVALLSILTFALSAVMLATGGMSTLWLTLMIVGGVIGVLPFIVIGAALLFQ